MTWAKPLSRVSLLQVYFACPSTGGAEREGFYTFFCSVWTCVIIQREDRERRAGQGRQDKGRKGEGRGWWGGRGEEDNTEYQPGTYHILLCAPYNVHFFPFWPRCAACGILVPRPGIETGPTAVKPPSLNHWTSRESPYVMFFITTLPGR